MYRQQFYLDQFFPKTLETLNESVKISNDHIKEKLSPVHNYLKIKILRNDDNSSEVYDKLQLLLTLGKEFEKNKIRIFELAKELKQKTAEQRGYFIDAINEVNSKLSKYDIKD